MLEGLLKGLVNKADATNDVLTDALEKLSGELNVPFSDFFIMIKPVNSEFKFRCDVYKMVNGKPDWVREITVKEIVGEE